MIVTLIGYRGCGKSSVGPLLAARLGCDCVDSDDQVEVAAGKSIAEIFQQDGEAAFRQIETDVLNQLLLRSNLVVAAGGGAILAEINRQRMRSAGPVVWLKASVATLAARITSDQTSATRRPSLTGRTVESEIADVLNTRIPLYQQAATMTVDADFASPEQLAAQIFAALNSTQNEGPQ